MGVKKRLLVYLRCVIKYLNIIEFLIFLRLGIVPGTRTPSITTGKDLFGINTGTDREPSIYRQSPVKTSVRLQRTRIIILCSDVELELYGRSGVLWYVHYYGIGPFLMHSSAKVLLNPYTQNQVFSIESRQSYA